LLDRNSRRDHDHLMALAQLEFWNTRDVASPSTILTSAAAGSGGSSVVELDVLRALDARSQFFFDNARAERTRVAYARDFRAFARWCTHSGLCAMPASTRTLARYLTHLADSGRKTSTVRRARIAIGIAHADAGAPRPDRDARIRTLERGFGRIFGTREEHATPLLLEHVERIVAACGRSARDDRDLALLLLGFCGAFRASELVALNIDDIALFDQRMTVFVRRSKEDGLAHGATVEIVSPPNAALCPVRALQRWLGRVGQGGGPLLRVVAGARVAPMRMTTRAVSRAVRRLALHAAIGGEFSSHSLRAGLATSAYVRGVSEREILDHGRWKDRRSLDRYIQLGAAPGRSNLVSLLS
jgi:site-specific recombinase XerD